MAVAGPPGDPKAQTCELCGRRRYPRYKTDRSWEKHQEFCRAPDAAPEAKRPRKADAAPPAEAAALPSSAAPGPPAVDAATPPSPAAPGAALADGRAPADREGPRGTPSLDDLPEMLQLLGRQLEDIEFATVQLGVTLGEGGLSAEAAHRLAHGDGAAACGPAEEPATQQLVRERALERLQREFRQRFPEAAVVSQDPELKLLLDLSLWQILPPTPTAIFLYGRYRKLARGIPQTRWPCAACRGEKAGRYGKCHVRGERGGAGEAPAGGSGEGAPGKATCEACKGTGLQYADSVQDLIGSSLVAAFAAEDGVFHGMGREDIDVRCLGGGRPFVLELKAPRRRAPLRDLEALAAGVNAACAGKVELGAPLRLSSRAEPARIKAAAADKTYTIRFRVEGGLRRPEDEACILALAGRALDQRTPARVEHRRADLVRGRTIISLGPLAVDGDEVELTIKAESGTYIKEFVHGDDGRTVPSVSGALGRRCDVLWLDVLEIHGE